jgi:hypothetical protein
MRKIMPGVRGIPASQLARDYGVSLNEFSESVINLFDKNWPQDDAGLNTARRREICAAVSAAMIAAFESSTLLPEEREKLHPLVTEVLLPFWTKHCAKDPDLADYITSRAAHYLESRVDGSQVKSAVNMVTRLLAAMDAPELLRPELQERLVPVFAHRMVGDVYRINEVRRKHGIELSVLATVCALLQMSMSYDPILRALRIV